MSGIKIRKREIPLAGSMAWRIQTWRVHHGLSQAKLAELIGVHQGTVSKLERGIIEKGRAEAITKLAALMGVSISMLYYGKEKEARGETEKEVLEIYRNMKPGYRKEWLKEGRRIAGMKATNIEEPAIPTPPSFSRKETVKA